MYQLNIETHIGMKKSLLINEETALFLSKNGFALSATPRKAVMKRFEHCTNLPKAPVLSAVYKFLEEILEDSQSQCFTIQIEPVAVKSSYSMTSNIFTKNLISDMWNNNVRFATILHIPTLTTSGSERVSDEFQKFLEDAYEAVQSAELLKQCPELASTLKEIRKNEDIEDYAGELAQDLYNSCGTFEFLINLEIRMPFNFRFNENGKYLSNSLGRVFRQQWILANNMIHAAKLAIQISEEIHQEEEQKARKEQGYV